MDEGLRAHMNKVYGVMSAGLFLTFAVAWAVGTLPALMALFTHPETGTTTLLGWIAIFAPLAMILFSGAVFRASAAAARTFFYLFAAVMGLSMSFIFAAYTGVSIAQTFLVTAGAFAGLSLVGYSTKRDLSGFGTFLYMGLIGIILASVVNLFVASTALHFAITVIGVLVFAGLTAYDTQKIKRTYLEHAGDGAWQDKAATMGALELYLDFINLFLMLLRLMGNRN